MVTLTPVFFSKAAATSVRPELEITPGLMTRISAACAAVETASATPRQIQRIAFPLKVRRSYGTPLLLWTYFAISGGLPRSATVLSQGKDSVGSLANRFILMVSFAPAPGASRTGKFGASTGVTVLPSVTETI